MVSTRCSVDGMEAPLRGSTRNTGGVPSSKMDSAKTPISVQGDASYTDTYYFSLTNYDASRVADYTLLGARFGWTDSSGLWNVGLKGENLADRRYGTVGFDITGLCGCTEIGYGKPRWIEASVRRQF